MTLDACGAVILAGGRSRRMGACKALLPVGGQTMLARLAGRLSCFDELLLSTGDPALAAGLPLRPVADLYRDAGPMGGLHAALSVTTKQALFCLPCDLPYYTPRLAELLLEGFPEGADAVVCRDGGGRIHPLCGIYRTRCLPAITACLEAGAYRMRGLSAVLSCACFDTGGLLPDRVFFNMNTAEDYSRLTRVPAGGALTPARAANA